MQKIDYRETQKAVSEDAPIIKGRGINKLSKGDKEEEEGATTTATWKQKQIGGGILEIRIYTARKRGAKRVSSSPCLRGGGVLMQKHEA